MKQVTQSWIDKAEGDLLVAQQSLAAATPVFDAICFHAQQCIEKYLKAWLQEQGIPYPRTHDLDALRVLVGAAVAGLASHAADLQWLTTYAVDIRYPGLSATRSDAERAVRIATNIRSLLRAALGLASI